jgi:hypothetical protein
LDAPAKPWWAIEAQLRGKLDQHSDLPFLPDPIFGAGSAVCGSGFKVAPPCSLPLKFAR